ncbi:heme/hemin ABC transporter substrate-binding protein [Acidimangrovimonas sediminis]|uniref:heme/hemin ABC transporter substrate-binding protein n=1 Tax=Acidimangrovimonas sediminis TaxID=2056283 RepID=UPI000C80CD06|nr:ABC transporter substrate-binding protein [Acidimangrovimonas sediminis]
MIDHNGTAPRGRISHARRLAGRVVLALSFMGALVLAAQGAQAADPARRIVSIGGATTEILYALGAADRIAAVDTTSTYPAAAKDKASVGYMRSLSPEGVLSVRPDLILMEEGAGPPAAVSVLKAAGVPLVEVPAGHDPAAIARKITLVADAVGAPERGRRMAAAVTASLTRLQTRLAGIGDRKRVLFVLSMSGGRPVAAGAGTGGDAIIRLAGGINAFASVSGYKTVSAEAAVAMKPDVILMMSHAGPTVPDAQVLASPALVATPAGRHHALIRMDGLYLLGFGPRTADAARDLAARLYPGRGIAAGDAAKTDTKTVAARP